MPVMKENNENTNTSVFDSMLKSNAGTIFDMWTSSQIFALKRIKIEFLRLISY